MLCETLFGMLLILLDSKSTVQEQWCGTTNKRPGDIYHPNFSLGKPAYFNLSVRGSLQPQFLVKAALQAGAAAEMGEKEKV